MLYQKLKQDRIQAMKNKDMKGKAILTYIVGELDRKIKDNSLKESEVVVIEDKKVPNDKVVIDMLNKYRKDALSNYKASHKGKAELYNFSFEDEAFDDEYLKEIQVYHRYLPVFIAYPKLDEMIDKIMADKPVKNAGPVIGMLKKEHGDAIDNAYVSEYVEQKLNQ